MSAVNGHSYKNGGSARRSPDGVTRLPPISKPKLEIKDPYADSKLMKFRLANNKQELLTKIMHDNAMQVYAQYEDKAGAAAQKTSGEPEYPAEMMSKDRRIRVNYQFLKSCVQSAPYTDMQAKWYENILTMIPDKLKQKPAHQEVIKELFEEVQANFGQSMKKSMVQYALVKPEIKGLEQDDNAAAPSEPTGLDYSRPWHADYVANKENIRANLHILHPSLQQILDLCQRTLGPILLVDCTGYRALGPLEFESLRNNIILECEKTDEKLMMSWYPNVINVFADKGNFSTIKSDKVESFYNCVTTLISNQLKDLLVRSIHSWVGLFNENNKDNLPILKMELTFDDRRMQFYPPYEDLEELVLFVVQQICKTMQACPTVQSWLSGGNTVTHIPVKVADHMVENACKKLKEAVSRNFEAPKAHLQSFMDRYNYIINGEAEGKIRQFMSEEHTFEEYCTYIEEFRNLAKQIMMLPSIEHFDMVRLDCEDLKRGLSDAAKDLANMLLERVAKDHKEENMSICQEFETMKERALKDPEVSEELMDMVAFVENARTMGMIKLNERIKWAQHRLQYLLDVHIFAADEIELNKEVLTWPQKINPVFDQNDELVEKSKLKGEVELTKKKKVPTATLR